MSDGEARETRGRNRARVSRPTGEDPGSRRFRDAMGRLIAQGGTPRNLSIQEAWSVLTDLMDGDGPPAREWPDRHRDLAGDLARFALRFSRPDGSPMFGPSGRHPERAALLERLAEELDEPGLATIARWWFPSRWGRRPEGPPPLPAFGFPPAPAAMLRADWANDGEALAIDARDPQAPRVELMVGGRPVLGPDWPGATGPSRLTTWTTGPSADCAEWSARVGASRITRTVVLLRGRKMALVAEERRGEAEPTSRIPLAPGVVARPVAGTRALMLKVGRGIPSVQAVPLSVPQDGSPDGEAPEGALIQALPASAQPQWLAWLLCWDEARTRSAPIRRALTVSEGSRACRPGVAFAARVGWGPGRSVVAYRSLGRPASRAFLGYQTAARFLIGAFDEEGKVSPLLALDD